MLLNIGENPPEWIPPPNSDRSEPSPLGGVASLISSIRDGSIVSPPIPLTKTKLQLQQEESSVKESKQRDEFNRQLSQWNPRKDPNIQGDPAATLFLARLPYSVTADQIKQEFSRYGTIESIRIVEPRRGYAFVVYQGPSGPDNAISAVQQSAGETHFHGRRILLDVERGRVQSSWKPRRLGGGLGGRFSAARQRAELARSHQIMRRGFKPPSLQLPPSNFNNKPAQSRVSNRLKRSGPYDRANSDYSRTAQRPSPHKFARTRTDNRLPRSTDRQGRFSDYPQHAQQKNYSQHNNHQASATTQSQQQHYNRPRKEPSPGPRQQPGSTHGRTLRQY